MSHSVIISSYDNPEVTAVHVRECMNSTVIPDEIIVVNDHGDKSLIDLLMKLEKKTKIIYAYILDDIPWNYTGARNLGVWLSKGDIISIEDTDNIPSSEAYEIGLKYLKEYPDSDRIIFGRRVKVDKKDAIANPSSKWKKVGMRPQHDDTQMMRREVYLKLKGCDERFAGKYAWACADWRRRLQRAGYMKTNKKGAQKPEAVTIFYWNIWDAETTSLKRRKSYENYELASQRAHSSKYLKTIRDGKELLSHEGHIQSPLGIINFQFDYVEF